MRLVIVFTCLIILAGCNIDKILHSPKHDTKKLDKIHGRNPNVINQGCLLWYPFVPIDTTVISGEIKTGSDTSDWQDQEIRDSISYQHDTVVVYNTQYKSRTVTIRDTIPTTQIITKLDSPSLARKKFEADSMSKVIQTLDKSVSRAKTQRNLFMWLFFGSLVASGALLYFKPKMLFK